MFQGQRERIYFSCLPHITIYKFLALELSLLPCPQHWIFPLRLIQTSSPYAESCIPFTDNTVGPMLNTGDRLCSGLAEGPQIVPISLQKSQLCPRKPESKKWQFPDRKSNKKTCEESGDGPFVSLALHDEKHFEENIFETQEVYLPCLTVFTLNIPEKNIFFDASWTFLRTSLLSLHSGHSDLPMVPRIFPEHSYPRALHSCVPCLEHSSWLCDTHSHFPQVSTQISPSQGPSRMTISQIPYASSHPLYPYPALVFFLALSPPDISDICLISVSPH